MLAAGRARRRDDGARRRHVRAGREGAGAQARHDVRSPRGKLYETVPRYGALEAIPTSAARSPRARGLPGAARRGLGRPPRRSGAPRPAQIEQRRRATRSTGWRSCSAGISACRAGGRSPARPTRQSTTRSGAGRRWARSTSGCTGSFLADPAQRTVVQIALNLLEGAAVVTRAQQLRCFGVPVPDAVFDYRPRRLG